MLTSIFKICFTPFWMGIFLVLSSFCDEVQFVLHGSLFICLIRCSFDFPLFVWIIYVMSHDRCQKKRLSLASRIWPSVLFWSFKELKKALDDAKVLNPKPFFLHSLPDFSFTLILIFIIYIFFGVIWNVVLRKSLPLFFLVFLGKLFFWGEGSGVG
jgi:hypothetical protein